MNLTKVKRYLILLNIGFCVNTFSQENSSITVSSLNINGFLFNQTETSIKENFGSPTMIKNYYNELNNENWKEYKYSENSFYFDKNILIEFSLKDNLFYFQNKSIRVGEHIKKVKELFLNSFNNKEFKGGIGFIRIELKLNNGNETDMFIIINFNEKNIITSIHSASN
ncbi:hypothetical protein [Flavobacterium sp.]|uniref:hypothetical protein n=1 Tax=Flavobacterium sp. TaxID=239 RepID=UPI002A80BE97|nr:hypothetical protein [Flavobacterium sp.]